jgi:hypothetical protein
MLIHRILTRFINSRIKINIARTGINQQNQFLARSDCEIREPETLLPTSRQLLASHVSSFKQRMTVPLDQLLLFVQLLDDAFLWEEG